MADCFPLINTAFFTNLIPSINAAATEEELQALVNKYSADLSQLEGTLTSQLAFMAPLLAVLTPPTDLGELVTWAGKIITVFTNMYKPFVVMTAQLAALPAEIATLTAAVEAAAEGKGFHIDIPPIAPSCTLP